MFALFLEGGVSFTYLVFVVLVDFHATLLRIHPLLGNGLVGGGLVQNARNLVLGARRLGLGSDAVEVQLGEEEVVVAAEEGDERLEDDDEGDDDEGVNGEQEGGSLSLAGEDARPGATTTVGSRGGRGGVWSSLFILDDFVLGLAGASTPDLVEPGHLVEGFRFIYFYFLSCTMSRGWFEYGDGKGVLKVDLE